MVAEYKFKSMDESNECYKMKPGLILEVGAMRGMFTWVNSNIKIAI